MIITIEGKQGEGKTRLAKKMCEGKKAAFVLEDYLGNSFWTEQIDHDTEVIFIDNVMNYEKTVSNFRRELLQLNKRLQKTVSVPMPDVILVLQNFKKLETL